MVGSTVFLYDDLQISAGTSPTLWTRGLATLGLAGTQLQNEPKFVKIGAVQPEISLKM